MNTALEYLLNFLQDEFRLNPEVKVTLLPKAGSQKSLDLEQDPHEQAKPADRGVVVRTSRREYFFPEQWVSEKKFSEIRSLANKIKDTFS
jgi:hypothetical protein